MIWRNFNVFCDFYFGKAIGNAEITHQLTERRLGTRAAQAHGDTHRNIKCGALLYSRFKNPL